MKYNKQWLIERADKKEPIEFDFFWGHQPSENGSVTKSCFSQWWVAPFIVDGLTFQTAEHWMMAEKARLCNDTTALSNILLVKEPIAAKKLGRGVKNFDPAIWNKHKMDTVVKGNLHKFSQHPELKAFLLNTGNKVIVEASPRDQIWGIGLGATNPKAQDPRTWRGQNLLGFALMEVRDQLRLQ
ncbi:MAG: NADAR family protein [Filimonas sp.]|nr:NADAR family protein [Filimonas sp.]